MSYHQQTAIFILLMMPAQFKNVSMIQSRYITQQIRKGDNSNKIPITFPILWQLCFAQHSLRSSTLIYSILLWEEGNLARKQRNSQDKQIPSCLFIIPSIYAHLSKCWNNKFPSLNGSWS